MMPENNRPDFVIEHRALRLRHGLRERSVGVTDSARLHREPRDPVARQREEHSDQK